MIGMLNHLTPCSRNWDQVSLGLAKEPRVARLGAAELGHRTDNLELGARRGALHLRVKQQKLAGFGKAGGQDVSPLVGEYITTEKHTLSVGGLV